MYDKKRAQRVKDFFTMLLTTTKGKHAGKPFVLLPWQDEFIDKFFGTVDRNGLRQYRTAYISMAKKNGKSEFAAGLALYGLIGDGELSAEVYSAAVDQQQAEIIYNIARQMVLNSPELRLRIDLQESIKRMTYKKKFSIFQSLSADVPSKSGLNVSFVVIDELWAHKDRRLYDMLTQGATAAREQPITIVITTAGNDKKSVCYELYDYAKKVKNNPKIDKSFLPMIYELDDDDDWENQDLWVKANPSLGVSFKKDNLIAEFKKAKEIPALETTFRQLRLNQWCEVSTEKIWLPHSEWKKCGKEKDTTILDNKRCFGGLDLSSVDDITALVLDFPIEGKSYILPFFWIPEETLLKKIHKDKVPYDVWRRQGLLKVTSGNVIDYRVIKNDILELKSKYNIRQINFDSWNSSALVSELTDEGLKMVSFRQGFFSLSPATKDLIADTLKENIEHFNNPILTWMSSNMTLQSDAAGNIKPTKERNRAKIDGMVALIMAHNAAVRNKSVSNLEAGKIIYI